MMPYEVGQTIQLVKAIEYRWREISSGEWHSGEYPIGLRGEIIEVQDDVPLVCFENGDHWIVESLSYIAPIGNDK